jgi:hypothetical protein
MLLLLLLMLLVVLAWFARTVPDLAAWAPAARPVGRPVGAVPTVTMRDRDLGFRTVITVVGGLVMWPLALPLLLNPGLAQYPWLLCPLGVVLGGLGALCLHDWRVYHGVEGPIVLPGTPAKDLSARVPVTRRQARVDRYVRAGCGAIAGLGFTLLADRIGESLLNPTSEAVWALVPILALAPLWATIGAFVAVRQYNRHHVVPEDEQDAPLSGGAAPVT